MHAGLLERVPVVGHVLVHPGQGVAQPLELQCAQLLGVERGDHASSSGSNNMPAGSLLRPTNSATTVSSRRTVMS